MKSLNSLFTTLLSCTFLSSVNCQFNAQPSAGQILHYNVLDQMSLSDTGAVGSSVLWDYSASLFDPDFLYSDKFRLPDHKEIDISSSINLVRENGDGSAIMYNLSEDSLVRVFTQNNGGFEIDFLDYWIDFKYPFLEDSLYRDTAVGEYYSGFTLVTTKTTQSWSITGTGELRTPTNVYSNVFKVSRYSTTEYFTGNNNIATVNAISIEWYEQGNSAALFQINWDDNSGTVSSKFLNNQFFASQPNSELNLFRVYPNPVLNVLHFSERLESYILMDIKGEILNVGSGKILDMSHYSSGVYLLTVLINDEYRTIKILKA